MLVRRLQLTNYRNYPELDLELDGGNHLFLGDNAQGKSNLFESVYLLATATAPRAGVDAELIARQQEAATQPFARVAGAIERRAGPVQLEVLVVGASTAPGAPPGRAGRRLRVNGIPRRAIDLVGQLRAVLFTAEDLRIIAGAPAERRAYLDATVLQVDRRYYGALHRYGRILQQRNASLRRIREGAAGQDELTLWDEGFVREAAVIIAARRAAVERLAGLAQTAQRALSGPAAEDLALVYEARLGDEWRNLLPAGDDAAAYERIFAAALAAGRRRDLAAGLSLVGPHRDDLSIGLDGAPASAFASRAQTRTIALALRLAQARLLAAGDGDAPVVLLDDVVSEMDPARRRAVLDGVADFEQVWLSATDPAGLPPQFLAAARVYDVAAGRVRRKAPWSRTAPGRRQEA